MNHIQTWYQAIPSFANSVDNILQQIHNKQQVTPKFKDILRAFELLAFKDVKVVVLGQDPYPTEGHANGLAFAVNAENKIPRSLQNIFKELCSDLQTNKIPDKTLLNWAKQGVLLLNTVLTTEKGLAFAHKDFGWQKFTNDIIKALNKDNNYKVFLLWGKQAQMKMKFIRNSNHDKLIAPHPSPLSARHGFFGCKHFSKTFVLLKQHNRQAINWLK